MEFHVIKKLTVEM